MGDDKTFVTKEFCDERLARVMAERKNQTDSLMHEIQNVAKRLDKFGEEIAQHATDACNGEIVVKRPSKEKYVLYGTAITTVGLVAIELIKLVAIAIA